MTTSAENFCVMESIRNSYCELIKLLSIHDLTRRSTCFYYVKPDNLYTFNSRPHTEVDMDRKSLLMAMMNFQFTTSHGGRPSLMRIWRSRSLFQFTTSHGGRREVANYENIMDLCAF